MTLPKSAKVIVAGGGIIGCSTAYHLGRMGCETLLLEKSRLTSGSTWHAAGLVGQLRSHANVTRLLGYSVELYAGLEAETGLSTGWKMNGGLRLACSAERWSEVRRQATSARSFGLEMNLLTAAEARELWPLMTIDDVVGAAFLPGDGQANPSDIALALAKGARAAGVIVRENTAVTGIRIADGRVTGVETAAGPVDCETLVLCCGQWTRALAARAGVCVPLASLCHQYMVSEPFGVPAGLPTLRDPDRLTYYKEEVGGLVMGGYEPDPAPWAADGIPEPFEFALLDSDFEQFEQIVRLSLPRVPALAEAGVRKLINAPESFTPDGNFILGPAPEAENVYVGAGFNAFGIAAGGGAGMALAEWAARGEPPYDLWPVDIRRFGRPHFDADWVRKRTVEAYAGHYAMAWPSAECESGRPFRKSPLYHALTGAGAVFGEKLGWERANWFAEPGEEARDIHTYGRGNWHDAVGREHRAARAGAALFDQSSFAKYLLEGPDAEAALGWLAANRVDREPGSVVYTQMLNARGGIECDLTCARMDRDAYYIVTGTGSATRDFDWIRRNVPSGMDARLRDVTLSHAVLSLQGPEARGILESATRDDVSNSGFPLRSWKRIAVSGAPVTAIRVSYVGELGFELHVPVEFAETVYEALHAAGRGRGLRNAGYRAIETLRLERGCRAWGSDIGPDHTPVEAGLGWAAKTESGEDFLGRSAILRQRDRGVSKMLATFTTVPDVTLSGGETVIRNGERCGWLTSGGYGHWIGKSIGMGYVRDQSGVDRRHVLSGSYELEAATIRIPAEVTLAPLHDPRGARQNS